MIAAFDWMGAAVIAAGVGALFVLALLACVDQVLGEYRPPPAEPRVNVGFGVVGVMAVCLVVILVLPVVWP